MLGVMIHGAMRNTTVSVKMGVSSSPWMAEGQRLGSAASTTAQPNPTTAGTFSGLSSSVTWKATSPEKPTSGKASPST